MDDPVQRPADVCVVGAGPSGLATALELGAAGRRVVVLESGAEEASPAAQALNEGDCEGEPYRGLRDTRHRGIGGSVRIWDVEVEGRPSAKYVPLSARDMAAWPIARRDLEPHYRRAQRLCGLGPFAYGAAPWEAPGRRPFDLDGTGLESGVYQFGAAERFTRALPERLRRTEGVRLVPSATVVGLLLDGRAVRGVRAVRAGGDELRVEAAAVVLACGAVENARLLLLAGRRGAEVSPWVGRGFMEHARDFSLELVPESPGIFARSAFYDAHAVEGGIRVGGRIAPSEQALDAHDLPSASATLVPRRRGRSRGQPLVERVLRRLHRTVFGSRRGRYGWSRVPAPGRAFDVFDLVLNLEQRPDRRNRVELGDRRDRHGNSLPRLVLRWTEEEQARLERLREVLAAGFREAGLGRLEGDGGRPDLSAHHHAGTTRMAARPEDGVVDPDGRVFGVENLYAAGASVFPSAGFANPTLTVVALSVRLSEHLDAVLG